MERSIEADLASAAAALQAFARGPAQTAADDLASSFERAGSRITLALGRAAFQGESAFRAMARSVLEEFAQLALDRVLRAAGGASTPSVGKSLAVHVHMAAASEPSSASRSQAQLAAAVARAVAFGSRNL